MRVMSRPAAILAALMVLAGCADRGTHPQHTFEIKTIDGVSTAATSGGPKYTAPIFEFSESLTLKQDESNPESLIANGGDYLMDASGNFYVPDYADMRFMVFDSQGNYVSSFGQQGSGPGDFSYPYLVRIDGERLVIHDPVNRRTSHHRLDGTLIEIYTPIQQTRYMTALERVEGRGQLILAGVVDRRGDEVWDSHRADLLSPDGDTLSTTISPAVYRGASYRFTLGGRAVSGMSRRFFRGRSLVHYVPPERLLVSTGVDPELRCYDISGALTHIVRLGIPREPVTQSDIAAIHARLDSTLEKAEGDQRLIQEEHREHLDIPAFKAYWSNVVVDDSGFLWLMKPLPEETWFDVEVNHWRVLSPEGEYLGDAVTPTGWGRLSQGHYLTYRTDPVTGARDAVVFDIEPAVPGLRYPN